jgi:hypothetical protein
MAERMTNLVEYFRDEGYSRFGFRGDGDGLTPEEAAIRAMREFDEFLKSDIGSEAYSKFLYWKLRIAKLVPA